MSVQHALAAGLEISVDLQPQALYHLDFLKEIDDLDHFRDQTFIARAVYRYEALWMPFAARHEVLVPPIDIHWVWLCHMLSPVTYAKDCVNVLGKVLDHRFMSVRENTHLQSTSRELWTSEYPSEPYDLRAQGSSDIESNTNGDSRISYDLVSAALRQTSFFYHVSLPHYRDSKFLEDASQRYRQFLFMAAENRTSFLVPCYDIDLIWHTHMSHPLKYQQDTNAIMGEVFNHDDSDGNREVGSKLQICANKTEDIWKAMFNENYLIAGTMYRGTPTKHAIHGTSITWSDYPKRQLNVVIKRCKIEAKYHTRKRLRNLFIDIKFTNTTLSSYPFRKINLAGSTAKRSDIRNSFLWSNLEHSFDMKEGMCIGVIMEMNRIRRRFCSSQLSPIGCTSTVLRFDQLAKANHEHSDIITLELHGFRFTIELLVSKTSIDECADMSFEAKQGSVENEAPQYKDGDMNYLWPVLEDNYTNDLGFTWTRSGLENSFGQSTVDVTIAHCMPLMTSVIQVRCKGSIKAVAHRLQPGELPLSEQVILGVES
ncbi:GRDP2-like protein [Mya arenaria]|uniref:GRDP2-like protein n=1 Tax=Mya arenaria TaxID=6604 RepID=A0ABY7EFN5_MYAAR|nr:GRDP2-like protein [Mya arenaria]